MHRIAIGFGLMLCACPSAPPEAETPAPAFTETVTGDLVIDSQQRLEEASAVVQRVTGALRIENTQLATVKGLGLLKSVGSISIKNNALLQSLEINAPALECKGSFELTSNPKLATVSFSAPLITTLSEVKVGKLPLLAGDSVVLSGLRKCEKLSVFELKWPLSLFETLEEVTGDVTLEAIDDETLNVLGSLTKVGGKLRIAKNTKLSSIEGFDALVDVRTLEIADNPLLGGMSLSSSDLRVAELVITGNVAMLPSQIRKALRRMNVGSMKLAGNLGPQTEDTAVFFSQLMAAPYSATSALNAKFPFDVSKDFLTVVTVPSDNDAMVDLSSITFPGNVQADLNWGDTLRAYVDPDDPGAFGFMLPQAPGRAAEYPKGEYQVRVATQAGTNLKVYVGRKPKPAEAKRLWLDVNLFFSGSAGVTSVSAKKSKRIQGAIEDLEELYGKANIEINEVRYYDVPAVHQVIENGAGRAAMYELSSMAPNGLNFFFIESNEHEENLLGQAGGIPGPTFVQGTAHSGVLVILDRDTVSGDDVLGIVMAHEGAHFLGLFHLIEFSGYTDNLLDTPDSGNAMQQNLMFPAAMRSMKNFSDEQKQVLRGNALIFE